MTNPDSPSYTIAEASALTGLHKNTIRMRIKLGHLPAQRSQGKFGEEYRISRRALVETGLLDEPQPLTEPLQPSESRSPGVPETAAVTPPGLSQELLSDLIQRHEQAMFRLGYLEAEVSRHKALAENAESLRTTAQEREFEIRELRRELEHAREREREIDELRALLREMEQNTERMRQEIEEHHQAAQRRWWRFLIGRGGTSSERR